MSAPRKQWLLDRFLAPVTFGTGPVDRVHRFFARDVWRVRTEALPWFRRLLYRAARVVFLTVRGFIGDGCLPRAAALTYITALSIIPMMALSFSVLKGLGLYERLMSETINPFLEAELGALEPMDGSAPTELRLALNEILERVDATDFNGLGYIGLLVVLWAAMRMLSSVEAAFNQIWGVARARTLVRRVVDYLAIVVSVPLFLVVAVGVTGALKAPEMEDWLRGLSVVAEALVRSAPVLGGWLMFSFVYVVMPNVRSRLGSAFLGGAVAFVLWFAAMQLHFKAQEGLASYNAFYAGFAAIPVFLVWIQASWVIVLLGAEVAFAHEHAPIYRGMASFRVLGHGARERLALRSVLCLADAFMGAGRRLTVVELGAELGAPPREVESVLRSLEEDGLVLAAEDREEGSPVFVLGRDPELIRIKHVTDALKLQAGEEELEPASEGVLERLLGKLDDEAAGSAYNVDLRELVRRVRRDERPGVSGAAEPRVQPS